MTEIYSSLYIKFLHVFFEFNNGYVMWVENEYVCVCYSQFKHSIFYTYSIEVKKLTK